MLFRIFLLPALGIFCGTMTFAQDFEIGVYAGVQTSPHSRMKFSDGAGGGFDFTAGWNGHSFAAPPYYGLRAMVWTESNWGFGAEFTHSKVYADSETLANSGFETLEFTDGINILTANAMYRWDRPESRWTPYVGGGLGVAIPHVEVEGNGVSQFGYQLTGPAMRLVGGASYALNDHWSVFAEYNGTYSKHDADLGDGASLKTKIITNAVNLGVSYSF